MMHCDIWWNKRHHVILVTMSVHSLLSCILPMIYDIEITLWKVFSIFSFGLTPPPTQSLHCHTNSRSFPSHDAQKEYGLFFSFPASDQFSLWVNFFEDIFITIFIWLWCSHHSSVLTLVCYIITVSDNAKNRFVMS